MVWGSRSLTAYGGEDGPAPVRCIFLRHCPVDEFERGAREQLQQRAVAEDNGESELVRGGGPTEQRGHLQGV